MSPLVVHSPGPLAWIRQALSRGPSLLRREPAAPLFGALVEDGEGLRLVGLAGKTPQYRLRRVTAARAFSFSFLCPGPGLCGVWVPAGEPNDDVEVRWSVEVHAGPDGRSTREGRTRLERARWSDWHWLRFDRVPDSRRARVRVRLRPGRTGQAFSVPQVRLPRSRRKKKAGLWLPWDLGPAPQAADPADASRTTDAPSSPETRTSVAGRTAHVRMRGALRILTYRWHVPHQYELYKLPHRFVLAHDLPARESRLCGRWAYTERPKPPNAVFAPWSEIRHREFDLLLLHFDENVIDWRNTRGEVSEDWGATFRFFTALDGPPKVAVCHGTPQFRGMCDAGYTGPLFEELPEAKRKLVQLIGDTPVVCNSHAALAQWGFANARVIWHGFDPREFPLGRRQRGILGMGGPIDRRPHYRGRRLHDEVVRGLPVEAHPARLEVDEPSGFPWSHGNDYAAAKFRRYVDTLGEYCVYFNPTLNSPMPRIRGEAMMCGLATVSARNHDVDRFIDNEIDGFHSTEAGQLRDYLLFLHNHRDKAREIGARGRARAARVFHISRFLTDWNTLLRELTGFGGR